jgi:hypothetical protein
MTARQPRTPHEAAMLDPMGLMAFPAPNIPRGLFGGSARRRLLPLQRGTGGAGYAADGGQAMDMTASPPPISMAPPPPTDWMKTVGSDLMGQLPTTPPDYSAPMQTLDQAPPMRGGILGSPSRPSSLGMFGNAAGLPASDKIGNRGSPLPMDANGNGKKGFDWRMLAGIIGDGLLGLNGQAPIYAQNMWKLRQDREQHNQRLAEQAQEWQYRNNQPDYATVGNRRYSFNPSSGESQVLYTAPSEAEDYAARFGVPGSDAYNIALQDYVLKYSGPTATDLNIEEEDNRQDNRVALEGVRQNNRIGLEGVRHGNRVSLRGMPTYRDSHPRPRSAGGSASGGRGGTQEGATATNPRTGEKVVYRGGKWVPTR